jgi:diacylglycerol kinase (ATP)
VSTWLVVFNPGARRGGSVAAEVRRALAAATAPPAREEPGRLAFAPVSELDAVGEAPGRVIAVGGDGTFNGAADWLARRGFRAPLAIVPAGTGNNLACGLGLPLRTGPALVLALRGRACRPLDAVVYLSPEEGRRRLLLQGGALGFPAEVAARYDRLRRQPLLRPLLQPLGTHVYRLLALAGLAAQKRRERRGEDLLEVRAALAGEEIRERLLALFIANERSLGGNFVPCPRARVDDGAFDLCFVRAGTGASYLKTFRRVARGEHLALEDVVIYRQSTGPVEIELSAAAPLVADGDLWLRSRRYRFEILPARFEVIVG